MYQPLSDPQAKTYVCLILACVLVEYWKPWQFPMTVMPFSASLTHYFLNQKLEQAHMHHCFNNKNSTSHTCINIQVIVYLELGLFLTSEWNMHEIDSLDDTVREWPSPGAGQKPNIPTTQKTDLRPFSHKLSIPASMFTMWLKATSFNDSMTQG